jgi:hypothetical protein
MLKSLTLLSLAASLTFANAQSPGSATQAASDQSQPPAPIVRSYEQHRPWRQPDEIAESQPTPGVWLRSESTSSLKTISATPQRTEVRLDHGRLNVNIHQPAQHSEILIDLPGGQTSLLKDGLYTFNADTNTVRVLYGEAAYLVPDAKPIKIKEGHQLSLVPAHGDKPGRLKPDEAYPYELTADLLPPNNHGDVGYAGNGYAEGYYPGYYGDYPPYAYPYYAGFWGYPYGFYPGYYGGLYGYPFAYGVGIGYYRGFGYHRGFRR